MSLQMSSREKAVLLVAASRLASYRRSASRHKETAVHAAADAHLKPMTMAVWYALLKGRAAYKSSGADAAVKAVRAGLLKTLPSALEKVVIAGGDAALGMLPKSRNAEAFRSLKPAAKPMLEMRFDAPNSDAARWAKEHAAELADSISATTEQIIKDAVAAAHESGNVDSTYDDILDAIGDEDRAQMIARTEVMSAANEGQQQGWEQASEAGLLPEDATVAWIATDVGACPECEALDGTTRELNGEYDDPDAADGPPLHPNCRCTEGIVGF